MEPVKEAFAHRPFNPESSEYKNFMVKMRAHAKLLAQKYNGLIIEDQ